MLVYRISKARYAHQLHGEGARRTGGRWNSVGTPMIYTASSISLGLLEILAHTSIVPDGMVVVTIQLPTRMRVPMLSTQDLPKGWDHTPPTSVSQSIGDELVRTNRYLALRVPSVIIPIETNVLINPQHHSADRISIVSIDPLPIDKRLK